MLQHVEFAVQLAERGEIYDLYAGNKYHKEIMNKDFKTWDEVENWFHPIMNRLITQLRNACNVYRTFTCPVIICCHSDISNVKKDTKCGDSLIGFLNFVSLEKLTLYTSIHVNKVDPKVSCLNENCAPNGELFQLCFDLKESPFEAKFARECNGTIVEKVTNEGIVHCHYSLLEGNIEYNVIAMTHEISPEYVETEHTDYGLDWKSITV